MPVFNPNIPVAHTQNDADPIRENFNALKDLIDAVPGGSTPTLASVLAAGNDAGTVPVRFTHDAGNYQELVMVPAMGDTAGILRLRGQFQGADEALVILGTTNTLGLTATPGGCQISFDNGAGRITGLSDPFNDQDADTLAARNAAIAGAVACSPANAGHWAGTPPASLAEAIDRLAAAYVALTGNPVP